MKLFCKWLGHDYGHFKTSFEKEWNGDHWEKKLIFSQTCKRCGHYSYSKRSHYEFKGD